MCVCVRARERERPYRLEWLLSIFQRAHDILILKAKESFLNPFRGGLTKSKEQPMKNYAAGPYLGIQWKTGLVKRIFKQAVFKFHGTI